MSAPSYPAEPKVIAATGAAPLAVAVASFLIWLLGVTVFGDNYRTATIEGDGVPLPVAGLVVAVMATLSVYYAGYHAPHQHRRSADGQPVDPVAAPTAYEPPTRPAQDPAMWHSETRTPVQPAGGANPAG